MHLASVGVVLPAAGSGRRMGGAPKQTRQLGNAPVWVQSLRAFASHPHIEALVVVVPEDGVLETRRQLDVHGLVADVVAGGDSRQASVGNGLAALPERVQWVLVHDAVRPFVSSMLISEVIAAARASGAAAPAVPVADTLRRADGDVFAETVSREGLWAMQTPQAARRDLLEIAYARTGDALATDEVGLLQRAGVEVALVEGDTRNIKLTRAEDWETALAVWPGWQAAKRGSESS
ncbi:MAG: 2-C-methyl-D-erythritol 4-phosphate cytidylyltransferase [Rubricoccaceae bacterium]